jgi:serine/threonine-protein kinase
MARSFLDRDQRDQTAVKLLDPVGPVDDYDTFEGRFLREASTLARLQHPNSVRVYDYGHWKNRTFLVMEYVDGYSLKRLLAGGPVPPSRMIDIAMQMCGALFEAHSLGLIHRDLKPGNVLLTRHAGALDVVKVVDFGLAKGYYPGDPELTANGQVLGTPLYMPPEQIRDEECDQRVDIYALGVLLYRGFTGSTPFPVGKTMDTLMANLHDTPRSFAEVAPDIDLPPVLEYVTMRCLEKAAEDRFANVMELRKALQACSKAVRSPAWRGISISLEGGLAVLPDEYTESSVSSARASASMPSMPTIDEAPPPPPEPAAPPPPVQVGVPVAGALVAAIASMVMGAGIAWVFGSGAL